ncbi:hypothetical protein C8R47DRAFT_1327991 [Mycena vitilis]|nr:hypothetical protein C8R47DRAFT_1327991 [Mycena vitilis]
MSSSQSVAVEGNTDALDFHAAPNTRAFSPREDISTCTFDIAASVAHSVRLNEDLNEDLAELDTGAAIRALESLSLADPPISTPSTHRARSQHPTKLRHHSHRTTAKLKADVLLGRRPRYRRHRGRVSPIQAVFKVRKLRIASTGWIGLADHGVAPEDTAVNAEEQGSAPTHTLADFFGPTATIPGFTLVPYLGPEARPILDSSGRVAAVFGGMPDEPDFMANVHDPAVEAMEDARTRASISEERQSHRRGVFTQLTAGVSFGGGQVQPGALVNGAINAAILASLLSSDPFIRLAGFATEFPPGCTIIIPSAAIFHSNIPIAPHERRYSFTQYTAGGLFRWVEHGFKTEEEYLATLTAEGRREEKELGLRRAREAAAMFSTLDELKAM